METSALAPVLRAYPFRRLRKSPESLGAWPLERSGAAKEQQQGERTRRGGAGKARLRWNSFGEIERHASESSSRDRKVELYFARMIPARAQLDKSSTARPVPQGDFRAAGQRRLGLRDIAPSHHGNARLS